MTNSMFTTKFVTLSRAPKYILVLAIMLLLIVLPSVNIPEYVQSTITSKFIVFSKFVLVVFGGFLLILLFYKPKSIVLSKLDITLLLFVIYITVNRYFIQSDYGFSIRYMELLGLCFLYVVLRFLSIKVFVWFLLAIIVSGSIQAVYGNLQLLGYFSSHHSGFKLTGSFFNPGPYAGFLTIVFAINLGIYLYRASFFKLLNLTINNKTLLKITKSVFENILLLALVSIVLVIPATHSRAAWIGVLLSSVFLLEAKYGFIKDIAIRLKGSKKIILTVLAIGLFCVGLFGAYHFKKGSADGRLFLWKVTSGIVKDFPVTGVGFDRFKAHYMNYQANYFAKHGETAEAMVADNSYYSFNDWLQFTAENGFVGVLLLLTILFMVLKLNIPKKHKFLYSILCSSILAIGTFAIFSYPMQILPIKLVLLVVLTVLTTLDLNKISVFSTKNNNTRHYLFNGCKFLFFALGFTGVCMATIYINTVNLSLKTWKTATEIYSYSDYEGANETYAKVYPTLKKDGDFLMNYGKSLTMTKQNKKAVQILEETKQYLNTTIVETALGDAYKGDKKYNKAALAYQHAQDMIPVRFYPLYLQAKLYEESSEKEKAVTIAKTILNKDIKVPSTAIKEIKAEMKNILKTSRFKKSKN